MVIAERLTERSTKGRMPCWWRSWDGPIPERWRIVGEMIAPAIRMIHELLRNVAYGKKDSGGSII
jgi:hypothetical protein